MHLLILLILYIRLINVIELIKRFSGKYFARELCHGLSQMPGPDAQLAGHVPAMTRP